MPKLHVNLLWFIPIFGNQTQAITNEFYDEWTSLCYDTASTQQSVFSHDDLQAYLLKLKTIDSLQRELRSKVSSPSDSGLSDSEKKLLSLFKQQIQSFDQWYDDINDRKKINIGFHFGAWLIKEKQPLIPSEDSGRRLLWYVDKNITDKSPISDIDEWLIRDFCNLKKSGIGFNTKNWSQIIDREKLDYEHEWEIYKQQISEQEIPFKEDNSLISPENITFAPEKETLSYYPSYAISREYILNNGCDPYNNYDIHLARAVIYGIYRQGLDDPGVSSFLLAYSISFLCVFIACQLPGLYYEIYYKKRSESTRDKVSMKSRNPRNRMLT